MQLDTIGQRVKKLREFRGISQSELGRRIKVTPQAIQSLESDKNPKRKTRHMIGIAKALDFDPKYLDLNTSFDQFRRKLNDVSEIKEVSDEQLIDEAIAQAKRIVTLRLKLAEQSVTGREYLELFAGEIQNLIGKQASEVNN